MKHLLFIVTLMVAFLGNAQLCKADTSEDPTKHGVITTPPAGEERHYYLDSCSTTTPTTTTGATCRRTMST